MSDLILLGVVSGLISALLIYLFRTFWKMKIEPWWENKLYDDARIDGEWVSELKAETTEDDFEAIEVKQVGHKICGNIVCKSGPDDGRKYSFEGKFRNQILTGYYWNTKKSSIDSGSFSLRLENDGNRLKGYSSYYQDDSHNIISREYEWIRKECM